ncbi:MAG: ORF6N domain-containing protein [Bacteroidota bacterium]
MPEPFILPDQVIINRIYSLRDQKIMFDKDLAELFDVKPTRLREQVKRNLSRFPPHFMFRLTEDEGNYMVAQHIIPSTHYFGGSLPYAFTEHGILQLSNVLKSEKATQISIRIIDVFIKMREILLNKADIFMELNQLKKKVEGQDERIDLMYEYLMSFKKEKTKREAIGYKNQ